ncbi:MAG: type VI secretion system baseplate subunit TssG [Candidatus Binataceae bacterium]
MAREDRTAAVDVTDHLLGNPRAFTFFQALRLLKLRDRDRQGRAHGGDALKRIRVRPNLTLKFPESDIEDIAVRDNGGFRLTANFLGLYGTASPLPTFYTEDLIDESLRDLHAARELIDVLNDSLYPLLFDAWTKSRPLIKVVEEQDSRLIERLFALIGLGDGRLRHSLPRPHALLRYIGLLTQFPRSALGLQTLLTDALGNIPVTVISCLPIKVEIPPDQRLTLGPSGCALGVDSFVGEEIDDRTSAIGIQIGPVSYDKFRELLPGAHLYKTLEFLTGFYPINPVKAEIELILEPGGAKPISLGEADHTRLGLDTWLFSGEYHRDMRARFQL